MEKLDRSFFNRNSVEVAKDLLGKTLICGEHVGIITETEAYRGESDPASHAYRGPTPRTQVMFGPPGFSYVYFIYGMYYCLNIVTEPEGTASAVLIRGLRLLQPPYTHLNGPGKLCRHVGLTTAHTGIDMITDDHLYVSEGSPLCNILATPRIGIKVATDRLWRFIGDVP